MQKITAHEKATSKPTWSLEWRRRQKQTLQTKQTGVCRSVWNGWHLVVSQCTQKLPGNDNFFAFAAFHVVLSQDKTRLSGIRGEWVTSNYVLACKKSWSVPAKDSCCACPTLRRTRCPAGKFRANLGIGTAWFLQRVFLGPLRQLTGAMKQKKMDLEFRIANQLFWRTKQDVWTTSVGCNPTWNMW